VARMSESPRFIIIDNLVAGVVSIGSQLVTLGYDADRIWPDISATPPAATVHSWNEAVETVLSLQSSGWDPKASQIFIIADLALDIDNRSTAEGIAALVEHARMSLRDYVFVVVTLYSYQAEDRLASSVDHIMDRSLLQGPPETACDSLKHALTIAAESWSTRTGRGARTEPGIALTDSPGARTATAVMGRHLLRLLVQRVAEGWTDVGVEVLTGGYSGSFVLKIDGAKGRSRRGVVCKISRDKESIVKESGRWRDAGSSELYARFVATASVPDVQTLGRSELWYIVLSKLPGDTLERRLLAAPHEAGPVIKGLVSMAKRATAQGTADRATKDILLFTTDDESKFRGAVNDLLLLHHEGRRRGCFNDAKGFRDRVVRLVERIASWPHCLNKCDLATIPTVEQHGDLNPRNVIIGTHGTFQLIDWARFGQWPPAYDLVRLQLQLLVRTVDRPRMRDAFPELFRTWALIWQRRSEQRTRFPWLSRLDRGIAAVTEPSTARAVALARCYDAVRMCSYGDISWTKRLWMLNVAVEAADEASLI
jgi:hypothetical protein